MAAPSAPPGLMISRTPSTLVSEHTGVSTEKAREALFVTGGDPVAAADYLVPMSPAHRIKRDREMRQAMSADMPPPAYNPAAAAPPFGGPPQPSLAERVRIVAHKLELEEELCRDLVSWAGTEVIVIADDSGSMSAVADVQRYTTRWEELRMRLGQLLDILLLVDDGGGFELRFLNQGAAMMIHSQEQLNDVFAWATPGGGTPLGRILREYTNPAQLESDRLIMVMTDGIPSDVNFEEP